MLALQRGDIVRVIIKLKASDVGTNILGKDRRNGSKSQSGGNDRETHSEFVVTGSKKKRSLGESHYNGPSLICRSNCAAKLLYIVAQRLTLMAGVEAELNPVPQPGIKLG
jgi:hypothetical protein